MAKPARGSWMRGLGAVRVSVGERLSLPGREDHLRDGGRAGIAGI